MDEKILKIKQMFNSETGAIAPNYARGCYASWLEEKLASSLAKPERPQGESAYSLLAEVRALQERKPDMESIENMFSTFERPSARQSKEMANYINEIDEILKKLSEHFS